MSGTFVNVHNPQHFRLSYTTYLQVLWTNIFLKILINIVLPEVLIF